MRINTIEGYENVRDCYWISNSDTDKVINRNTGKQLKIRFDYKGYKRVELITKQNKVRCCKIHVLKAKAFIFGPNPLDADQIRHLNDVKTDNRLINLVWGTASENMKDRVRNGKFNYEAAIKGGKIAGKINGKINGKITGKINGKINGKIAGKINGAKTGAKNGKRSSKPVRCIETGIIYPSCIEVERCTGIHSANISRCCNGRYKTAGGFHWQFVDKE